MSISPKVGMRLTEHRRNGNYYDIVAVEADRLKIRWRRGGLDTTGFHNFEADTQEATISYPTLEMLKAIKNAI